MPSPPLLPPPHSTSTRSRSKSSSQSTSAAARAARSIETADGIPMISIAARSDSFICRDVVTRLIFPSETTMLYLKANSLRYNILAAYLRFNFSACPPHGSDYRKDTSGSLTDVRFPQSLPLEEPGSDLYAQNSRLL